MEEFITVSVSPFYNGRGWTDAATGIDFERTDSIRQIRIAKNKDLSGIQNSIRLNNLLLLEGKIEGKAKELSIENINPEELTKEQFSVLAEKLKAGQEDPKNEKELAETKELLKQSKKELAEKDAELERTKESLKAAEEKLAKLTSEPVEKETLSKKEAEQYNVEELKSLLDEKGIDYAAGDKKQVLVKKLTAPAK